ncbi:MAG: signal peptidase II [Rhodobacteraceae bacterium]|nr:signal peptidase II [Paracoccaceae bacterium]
MKRILTLSILIFVLDQASKWIVVEYLDLKMRQAINVFPPYLNLRMAWNEGVNFGLFSDAGTDFLRWILIAIALMVTIGVLWWGRRFTGWFGAFLVGCIIGGALGNTVDRIVYGAVADFFNMSCCGLRNPYSFNVADIAIFIGAFGLVLFSDRLQQRA